MLWLVIILVGIMLSLCIDGVKLAIREQTTAIKEQTRTIDLQTRVLNQAIATGQSVDIDEMIKELETGPKSIQVP